MRDQEPSPDLTRRLSGIADGLLIAATRRLGDADAARDAVQETLTRLWVRFGSMGVPPDAEIAPLAWGIARHVIADMLRDRARPLVPADHLVAPGASPIDALVAAEDAEAARAAIAELPEQDQELLVRCFVNGERIVDIALETGEPADRLRKRKSRALARLAARLAPRLDPAGHESAPMPMERV